MTAPITSDFRPVAETDDEVLAPLLRLMPANYADGTDAPAAISADAELLAFDLFSQGPEDMPGAYGFSSLWIFWGQFLDHDMDIVPEQDGPGAEFLKVEPPFNVVRSEFEHDAEGVRQQLNAITPAIDASNVYGSSEERTNALRSFEGGRLMTREGPDGGPDLLATSDQVFGDGGDAPTAGDIRATENAALTSLHTLWVNEHNHWADRIAEEAPAVDDEQIFQQARAVVEAEIQKITYDEFLPVLLGDALEPYEGHDPEVDLQVTNEFATAAYRFGHTAIPGEITYLEEDGAEARPADALFDVFENPAPVEEDGISPLLRGLLEERAQEIDTKVVDDLNFFLFTPDGGLTGFSLPERNILRGRDHGLETWLETRAEMVGDVDAAALAGSTDFSIITSNPALRTALEDAYGALGEVDLWVGGLAEDHVPGSTLGPTFQAILADQFARARDGDAHFYLNRDWADPDILTEIEETTLADVIARSGGVEHVQREAMLASDRIGGTDGADSVMGSTDRDLAIGLDGNDRIRTLDGDDDAFGDAGDDTIQGGNGDDGLNGGAGDDKLFGQAGNDELFGGTDEDSLYGAQGDDILSGGDGTDMLFGGAGADSFVFVAGESGIDSIVDFRLGEDLIVLRGFGIGFEDLEISGTSLSAALSVGGEVVAKVYGGAASQLDTDSFEFVM